MATNKQLKFFKGAVAPAAPAAGMIWFCTGDRTIRVYTGSEWEKYSGLVNAEWVAADKKLNITSANGTVTTLDLSDCASASDITAKLATINNTLTSHDTRITTAQSAADAANEKIGDGFSKDSTIASQLAAVKSTADAAAVRDAVNASLELKADKTQVATDIATAKQGAIDAAAADATTKADAAQAAAIAEATRLDGLMDARVDALEAAVGTGGSVDEAITAKIDNLDADVTSAEGTQVRVQVVEVDGKITEVKVTESATFATAQALADEIADRAVDEQAIIDRVALLDTADTGRVSVLEKKVDALNAATHFEGKVEFDPSAEGATTEGYEAGDIVIYGNKEYIFDGTAWIELGDTTAESNRISALEGLVGTTSVGDQIDAKIAALSDEAKSSDDANLVKVTVSQADGNVTGVSLDDSKLDQAISNLDSKIGENTAAHEANAAAIKTINETTVPGINSRLDGIDEALDSLATSDVVDGINTRLQTAEGEIDALQAAIERLDGEQDTQDEAIAAAKTQADKGVADAAAALAEAQSKVASVTAGNDYVSVGGTATDPTVSVNVTGQIAEGNTGLVNGGAIFNELCWVEFE